jgi:hypothetical protein
MKTLIDKIIHLKENEQVCYFCNVVNVAAQIAIPIALPFVVIMVAAS